MRKRYRAAIAALPKLASPAIALRHSLAAGYGRRELTADLLAGVVVGLVALPLAMALGINSGVEPQNGIYTAIVAGLVIAALGGSRVSVSGPTAAFVVILAPIAARDGLAGLAVATAMAGVILVAMGLFRLGRLVQFIPHPVTTGFTAGIAVVIATLQIKDFFALEFENPEHYVDRVAVIVETLPEAHWGDAVIGAFTLALLLVWPKLNKRVPAPLVALAAGGVAAWALARGLGGFHVETIASKFGGIPQKPPLPVWPWELPGAHGGEFQLSLDSVQHLMMPAFAIAMLGAIESLLCAVVADGMAGTRHDPDAELVAQGVGNFVVPFFGGVAATGAIARTATNVRAGGRSPVAAMAHAIFVLVGVVAMAPLLGYLPMASMAALLLLVAWNMSEFKHFVHILRVAPKSDVAVLLTCFFLTVIFDMTIAVSVGVVLAALLFMRRMADLTSARLIDGREGEAHARAPLPSGVIVYEIGGPLFFGAAQKAMSALDQITRQARAVILDMSAVPAMDVTGLVALESVLERLRRDRVNVVLAGVQPQPRSVLEKGGIVEESERLHFAPSVEAAVEVARGIRRSSTEMTAQPPPAGATER